MSFLPVVMYGVGLAVFGFIYYILDGIRDSLIALGIHESGNAWNILCYLWGGIIIIYLIFGGIWLIRKYNEKQYMGGML